MILPVDEQFTPPGQLVIVALSPKFQAKFVIVCPCAVVDDDASKTTVSPTCGPVGENVKLAVGAGGPPTVIVVAGEVVD
jgi:hypothetical protein